MVVLYKPVASPSGETASSHNPLRLFVMHATTLVACLKTLANLEDYELNVDGIEGCNDIGGAATSYQTCMIQYATFIQVAAALQLSKKRRVRQVPQLSGRLRPAA
jgi:hypothetical protein